MRLLLVEDDASLAAGLSLALRNKGFAVNHVTRGDHALHAVATDPPDLIVLDLGLPDMEGLEVLRTLRAGGQRLPILVLTARDTLSDKVAGLDLGADDYLAKPFEMPELEARIRALGRRLGSAGSSLITLGDLQLDTASMQVHRAGVPVDLSRREYALLKALLENSGKVLTRETLEGKLYGWDEEVASNTLEVHIHHLRRKLGQDLIRTVRGVGYCLRLP
ncbi:response regulator [Immundisolibacter cernigliae]|uniref:DNA-binding response regulator n=1 Tax=Immundisolibacter cernigliae TaxID=1810504 RepID=A0A1B1YSN4_9GAMM|nr:response regulator [Immundisolibacter cernigliae]ANX03755.1 DNA-binding response regulator [Immundisolibacter cernigliae]